MAYYSRLNYVPNDELVDRLKPFLVLVLQEESQVARLMRVIKSAGVTYPSVLTAVKIYRRMHRRLDKYLVGYDSSRMSVEYYRNKEKQVATRRIPKGHSYRSVYAKYEQNSKVTAEYEKGVIRELFYDSTLVLIGCFVVSLKMYNDVSYTNESWETVTGIECTRINLMEKVILEALEYNLYFEGEREIEKEIHAALGMEECNKTEKRGLRRILRKVFCMQQRPMM